MDGPGVTLSANAAAMNKMIVSIVGISSPRAFCHVTTWR